MTLKVQTIRGTTTTGGTATAQSPYPIGGRVIAVRNPGTWGTIAAGTADYVFKTPAEEGAGTVLSLSNQTDPFTAYCGGSIQGGGASAFTEGAPCDGYLEMVVVQAAASTAGTVYVYYEQ